MTMSNRKKVRLLKSCLAAGASLVAILGASGAAGAETAGASQKLVNEFRIAEGALKPALDAYIAQSGEELVYRDDQVAGLKTKGASGSYTNEEALERLLIDTGLVVRRDPSGAILIMAPKKSALRETPQPIRMAQANTRNDAAALASGRDADSDDAQERDVIIVTGTNIRGIAPESSPVRSFTREDIEITGAATAQDFIQTLPQNFRGTESEGIFRAPDMPTGNFGSGSSVNLRGLGSGSTLVLVNGRRLAPSSGLGGFVDISVIPASAIERVDVLTDGASSIYGADAVAGVVNFVLRDDYDGAEASVRYGGVTQGSQNEIRASGAAGINWNKGNGLIAYEFYDRDSLSAGDRDFSRGAPLPNDILPTQQRHSVLVSASQDLSSALELSADFGYSSRESRFTTTTASGALTDIRDSVTDTLSASLGASLRVTDAWSVDLSGTYGRVDLKLSQAGVDANDVNSQIYTTDIVASGDLFSLPGGDVKLAFGAHYRNEDFANSVDLFGGIDLSAGERDVYALFGELFLPVVGAENSFPGVKRLEVNVSGRYSDFSDFGETANPKVGVLWSPIDDLRLRGSYSTSFNPPPLGNAGAFDRQGFSYSTAVINAQRGLTPGDPSIADVTGIFIAGTAEDLDPEESRTFTVGVDFDKSRGSHLVNFSVTYFDIRYRNRLGAVPIPDNRDRFDGPNIAINTPEAFPEGTIIFNPSPAQISDAISSVDFPFNQLPGSNPDEAAFINFISISRNLSLSVVRGFDFDVGYAYTADHGVYSLGLDASYLNDFQEQAASTTTLVERVNTQFNPIDWRLRGRVGYAHKGFSANLSVNFMNDYAVDSTPNSPAIDSWTTFDLFLGYSAQERFAGTVLQDTQYRLSVRNIFDENPPSTPGLPSLRIFGYDPTNATPQNRFISFEATKRF